MHIDIDQVKTKSIEFTHELMNAFYKYSIIGWNLLHKDTQAHFLNIQDVIFSYLHADTSVDFHHKAIVVSNVIKNIDSVAAKTADAQLRDKSIDEALKKIKLLFKC